MLSFFLSFGRGGRYVVRLKCIYILQAASALYKCLSISLNISILSCLSVQSFSLSLSLSLFSLLSLSLSLSPDTLHAFARLKGCSAVADFLYPMDYSLTFICFDYWCKMGGFTPNPLSRPEMEHRCQKWTHRANQKWTHRVYSEMVNITNQKWTHRVYSEMV